MSDVNVYLEDVTRITQLHNSVISKQNMHAEEKNVNSTENVRIKHLI